MALAGRNVSHAKKGVLASRTDARTPHAGLEIYLLCVSVVVVVVGPGSEVCDEVVVVLWVASDSQPQTNAMVTPTRQDRIIFFIGGMVIWIFTVPSMNTPPPDAQPWGVTRPDTG